MKFALKTALAGLALAGAVPTSAAIVSYNGTSYNPGDVITIFFDRIHERIGHSGAYVDALPHLQ